MAYNLPFQPIIFLCLEEFIIKISRGKFEPEPGYIFYIKSKLKKYHSTKNIFQITNIINI